MAEKVHCDRCDRVIPDGEELLELEPSLQVAGGEGTTFPDWHEQFCFEPCVKADATLMMLWVEAHRDVELEKLGRRSKATELGPRDPVR